MTTENYSHPSDEARRKRVLLLLTAAGDQAEAFRETAEKLGITLAAGSDRSDALEEPWRAGAIALDAGDPYGSGQAIVEYAETHPLDAVIAIEDRLTIPAAIACETLGIPCHQPYAVLACNDRFEFRSLLEGAGLPVTRFARLPVDARSPALPSEMSYPCVLKPAILLGSRAAVRADNGEQFAAAFGRIRKLLESPEVQRTMDDAANWILVEEPLEGPEVTIEGIIDRGRFYMLAIFDRQEMDRQEMDRQKAPNREGTIHVTPSRLAEATQTVAAKAAALAAHAVGLYHGPVHAEIRLTEKGPRVLEISPRAVSGPCARTLRFENDWALEELVLRHALGEGVEAVGREEAAAGAMTIPAPADGVLEEVRGEADARGVAGIEDVCITAKLKEKLVEWPEGASCLGYILARGETPDEVETALREARRRLEFRVSAAAG